MKILSVGNSLVIIIIFLAGCSPVMEVSRPDPVDTQQFVIGESRLNVISQLGSPASTMDDSGKTCDIYKIYTRGPNAVEKGVIAAGEAVADVFTIGLAEVIFTPTEAATSNDKHAVVLCYDKNNKLVSLNQSDSNAGD